MHVNVCMYVYKNVCVYVYVYACIYFYAMPTTTNIFLNNIKSNTDSIV